MRQSGVENWQCGSLDPNLRMTPLDPVSKQRREKKMISLAWELTTYNWWSVKKIVTNFPYEPTLCQMTTVIDGCPKHLRVRMLQNVGCSECWHDVIVEILHERVSGRHTHLFGTYRVASSSGCVCKDVWRTGHFVYTRVKPPRSFWNPVTSEV